MKFELVDNARFVLRFFSTWIALIAGALASGLATVLALQKAYPDLIPHWLLVTLAVITAIAAFLVPIGAVIKQQFPDPPPPSSAP